jgi:oxaloacetate decarboxylase (Na+ extruding) subunit alpha
MPALVDTTIRLLGQEPLAGRVPTAEILRLAEILDGAGFAYLEVSGGGCFDSAVKRGVESPWERLRMIKARTTTPLGLALRGKFLVGDRPVDNDFARRFVACAAENGIDVFRLNDPLNDVSNLRDASEAIAEAGRELEAGLVYSAGKSGETEVLVEQARRMAELGAARILLHDPTGALLGHRSFELTQRIREATSLPVGIYCQGASGAALSTTLAAERAGADLLACTLFPLALTLHRVSAQVLAETLIGRGRDPGIDVRALWRASDIVDEHIGDEPVRPLAPRIAVRAAEHELPAGLVAGLDTHLRAYSAGDRLDDVIAELARIRDEVGGPPLAAPIGQMLASQALLHVLSAERWLTVTDELRALILGRYGMPPGPIDPTVLRAVSLSTDPETIEMIVPPLDELRDEAEGLATSEEELLLLGLFGSDAAPLLNTIRNRGSEGTLEARGVERSQAERIREIVRIVQESGVGEVTIDDGAMTVTVRRTDQGIPAAAEPQAVPLSASSEPELAPVEPASNGLMRIESPMVGTFYRGSQPGAPPFVQIGDAVGPGHTLCILEAMKLMNEVKADQEGIVRAIHVENAQPVEFGQLLFELEPIVGVPLDGV